MISQKLLSEAKGVIHVGAHAGEEAQSYADLNVLWIEANPFMLQFLKMNTAKYPKQTALCRLIIDRHGGYLQLHHASNAGFSSSIFPLSKHKEAFPQVKYEGSVWVETATLDKLEFDRSLYDVLVLDIQGAELLALKGAEETLKGMKYVETEAYPEAMYEGGCTMVELNEFFAAHGFAETERQAFSLGMPDEVHEIVYKNLSL